MPSERLGPPASAVVFAYHNVGVRGLAVLLDAGVDVKLVVTHADDPGETRWFASVAETAAEHGLPCIAPGDARSDALFDACRAASPDLLFSFYYRSILAPRLLVIPRAGAFNIHGSLLPRYRGRAPVNWAILRGERETGATLHVMDEKPDHGPIVDQCAVPILIDDTARIVFDKVTLAAEIVLARALPGLLSGSYRRLPQNAAEASVFGRRSPEDGRIALRASAREIHDLVRAVAPPDYPGAFVDIGGTRITIGRTRVLGATPDASPSPALTIRVRDHRLVLDAVDGHSLEITQAHVGDRVFDAAEFHRRYDGNSFLTSGPSAPGSCSKS